jgi:membrane protein implicated in regulation of membrane protease activity
MKTLKILKYVGFGILGLGFITLAVFLTMSLWNALIPQLFHGPVLTFWQTAGLFILSKILLTGVAPGSHNRNRSDWRRKYNNRCRPSYSEEDKTTAPDMV